MRPEIRYLEVYISHSSKTINNPFWLTEAKMFHHQFLFPFSKQRLLKTLGEHIKTTESADANAIIMGVLLTYFVNLYKAPVFSTNYIKWLTTVARPMSETGRFRVGWLCILTDMTIILCHFVRSILNPERIYRNQMIHPSVFILLKDYFSYLTT